MVKILVKKVISDNLCIDTNMNLKLSIYDLGADSINRVEIITEIEELFNIEIPEIDWKDMLTSIEHMINYVTDKLGVV